MSTDLTTVEGVLRHRLAEMLGGWRGALEVGLPTVAYVVWWSLTKDVMQAVIASAALVLVAVVLRLLRRETLRYALSSVFPTVIAALFALRSGRAEAAFLPGILWNAWMALFSVGSIVARWPLFGFMVAAADPAAREDLKAFVRWRQDPGLLRVCTRLTAVMAVLFVTRVAVMYPLYAASQVELLGIAKIVLGWPAYLAAVTVMAAMLWRGHTPVAPPSSGGVVSEWSPDETGADGPFCTGEDAHRDDRLHRDGRRQPRGPQI